LVSAAQAGVWSQGYGYDEYGNRWVPDGTNAQLPKYAEMPVASSWYGSDNRIYGFGYDAAGNMTSMGGISRSFV
jgi:hypothetical protein